MAKQAFEGIKVADFTWSWVGPVTARYLADYGATVIHIESSTSVDLMRAYAPYKDRIPGINRAGQFAYLNCNKYGISLNLNHPKGPEIARRIVAWADIVAESFTPGIMKKWGLDYESVREIKPDIIYYSASMQGQTGPRCKSPGYGPQVATLAGFTHLTGWPDSIPGLPYAAYSDAIAPYFGVTALIAALDYRRRTGKGRYLDLSQYEASLHFLAPVFLDYTVNRRIAARMGNRCSYAAPHGAYPCRGNDRWIAIAVLGDEEWQAFCKAIGNPAWTEESRFATFMGRKENEAELDRLVGEWTRDFAAEQVMVMMQAAGVPAGVLQNAKDIHNDPQLKHRQYLYKFKHTEIGTISCDTFSFKLSKTPAEVKWAGPCMGEHNEYVYTKLLGMSDKEFIELLATGVFE